jgi:hypothetical protein
MQASRKPRRSFAAPLVAIGAAAAIPACIFTTSSSKPPATHDHRTDGTGSGSSTDTPPNSATHNPPMPQHDPKDDPTSGADTAVDTSTHADPAPGYERDWTVSMNDDGSCVASLQVACKKGQTCNPPRPSQVECPKGITADGPMHIYAASGSWDCFIKFDSGSCPKGATCNPPPPKQTACPGEQ